MKNTANRRILSFALTLVILISMAASISNTSFVLYADAAYDTTLGDILHYNGITFSGLDGYQADIEGALASGGNSVLGRNNQSFDIGGSFTYYPTVQIGNYTNPYNYPTLLLQGSPDASNASHVSIYGGPLSINASNYRSSFNKISAGRGIKSIPDDETTAFFKENYQIASNTVRAFKRAHTQSAIKPKDFLSGSYRGNLSRYQNQNLRFGDYSTQYNTVFDYKNQSISNVITSDDRVLVIPIGEDGGESIEISQVILPSEAELANYDLLVLSFETAKTVHFSSAAILAGGKMINTSAPAGAWLDQYQLLESYSRRVVWSFPEAKTIQISGKGIVGSVIAPDAQVFANGGSINGMLISDYLEQKGGFELHAFRMKNVLIPGTDDPDEEEDDEDEPLGRIRIIKYDAADDDTSIRLPDAVFELYKLEDGNYKPFEFEVNDGSGKKTSSFTTNEFGEYLLENLPYGDYMLKEIQAPEGYTSNGDFYFTISDAHNMENDDIIQFAKLSNKRVTTGLELEKQDDEGNALPGAEFYLYRFNENTWELILKYDSNGAPIPIRSGSNGVIALDNLSAGTYMLVETKSPDGYYIDKDERYRQIDIAPDSSGNLQYTIKNPEGSGGTNVIKNPKLGESKDENKQFYLEIIKIDSTTHQPIKDVEFEVRRIKDETGKAISPPEPITPDAGSKYFTTNEFGMVYAIGNYKAGVYQYREFSAPYPYNTGLPHAWDDKKVFEIDYSTRSGRAPGAGSPLALGTSDQTAGTSGPTRPVPLGASLGVPTAYSGELYYVENDPHGEIKITKRDEESGSALKGAQINLYRRYFGQVDLVAEGTTDEKGEIIFSGLSPAAYYLYEVNPPTGYQRKRDADGNPAPIIGAFEIALGASHSNSAYEIREYPADINKMPVNPGEIILYNKKVEIEIKIIKVDADDHTLGLSGAVFDLYYFENNSWKKVQEGLTTDAKGIIDITQIEDYSILKPGTYKLKETTAPTGYSGAVEYEEGEYIFYVSLRASPIRLGTHYVVNEKPGSAYGKLQVVKIDALSLNPLPNAEFRLYRRLPGESAYRAYRNNILTELDGRVTLEKLLPAAYVLMEVEAPEGYVLGEQRIYFTVEDDGSVAISGLPVKDGTITVPNDPETDPTEPTRPTDPTSPTSPTNPTGPTRPPSGGTDPTSPTRRRSSSSSGGGWWNTWPARTTDPETATTLPTEEDDDAPPSGAFSGFLNPNPPMGGPMRNVAIALAMIGSGVLLKQDKLLKRLRKKRK